MTGAQIGVDQAAPALYCLLAEKQVQQGQKKKYEKNVRKEKMVAGSQAGEAGSYEAEEGVPALRQVSHKV